MIGREALPPGSSVLDLRLAELKQLFNAMDPAPFRERDLDPRAAEYIVEWARERPSSAPLALAVRLGRGGGPEAHAVLQHAVSDFFADRALATRRELRKLLRTGRVSLVIGLAVVALALFLADVAGDRGYGIVHESLVIGGWVAVWRPLDMLLYDWWPILAEARLYDRLARMSVELVPTDDAAA